LNLAAVALLSIERAVYLVGAFTTLGAIIFLGVVVTLVGAIYEIALDAAVTFAKDLITILI